MKDAESEDDGFEDVDCEGSWDEIEALEVRFWAKRSWLRLARVSCSPDDHTSRNIFACSRAAERLILVS
jgi:hypothetical protein